MMRIVAFLFLLLFVGILYAAFFVERPPPGVEVMTLAPTDIESTIRVTGRVESARTVDLSALLEGVVTAVHVNEGDLVEADAVLMSLDDRQAQVQVKMMENRLASFEQTLETLRRKYQRLASVSRSGGVAAQDLEEERSALLAAESDARLIRNQIESVRIFLADTKLRAPFAGRIIRRKVEVGQWVEPSDRLMTLAAWDDRWIAADVDAADSALVVSGQRVHVSAEGWPEIVWQETILSKAYAIEREAASTGNSFAVRISLGAQGPELLLGQQVDVKILVARAEGVLAVPFSSLREQDGRHLAAVVEDGVVRYREVETGIEDLTRVEVRSGLSARDRLVVNLSPGLEDGAPVTVTVGAP